MKLGSDFLDNSDLIAEMLLGFEARDAQAFWSFAGSNAQLSNEAHFFKAEYSSSGSWRIIEPIPFNPHPLKVPLSDLPKERRPGQGVRTEHFSIFILKGPESANRYTLLVAGAKFLANALTKDVSSELTNAETTICMDLLVGLTLKESAENGGVTYETRRSQLKVLLAKFDVPRQGDLVRTILTSVLSDTKEMAADKDGVYFLRRYLAENMPPEVRLHVIQSKAGITHRILDYGPRRGTPILAVHPPILGHIGEAELAKMAEANQRVIWPFRNGSMAPEAPDLNPEQHLAHALDGLKLAHETFIGEPCVLMSMMDGAQVGIEYERAFPETVQRLVFVNAPASKPTSETMAGRVRSGALRLVPSNMILKVMMRFIANKSTDLDRYHKTLRKVFGASAADVRLIDREFAGPDKGRSLQLRFLGSLNSIRHGFQHQAQCDWFKLNDVSKPIHFLHGEEDPIHPIEDAIALARSVPGATIAAVKDCGKICYFEAFFELTDMMDDILKDRPSNLEIVR